MSYLRLSESERKTLCAARGVPLFPRKPGHTFLQHPAGYVVQYEDAEAEALVASPSRAMVSIPTDPTKAREQTFRELVHQLRLATIAGTPDERRKAQKALDALEGRTTTKEAKMSKAYESPLGNIPSKKDDKGAKRASDDDGKSAIRSLVKVISKSANDPNDPKREQAKKLLQLLADFCGDDGDDEQEASDETEDATRPKGVPAVAGAKATNLSPYAAMLDEQMGLAKRPGIRVEGSQLILSAASRGQR